METRSLEEIEKDIVEKQKALIEPEENISTIEQSSFTPSPDVSSFRNETIQKIQQAFKSGEMDADEGIKQVVNVLTIIEATSNEKLRKDMQREASKSMKSFMRGIAYKDEEKKLLHRQRRNEAFYKAFRPILEFDLSHLIGKRKKRVVTKDTITKRRIVSYEDVPEEQAHTYTDRSYGLTLMIIMVCLFIIPYSIANIVLAVGRMINAMFECFAQFGRTAFWICTSIAGIAIIGLFVYVLLLLIEIAFGVKIFA